MKIRFFAFVSAILMAGTMYAADKVAYLNMEKVFENYYKTVQENYQFELQKQNFEERHTIMRDEYQSSVREAQRMEADSKNELLSQAAREDNQRKLGILLERLQVKRDELMQFRQSGMQELQNARNAAEEELIRSLTDLVKRYAKEKEYTHVYEVSGRSLNRVPFLMVYPEELEITDAVISFINLGHESELQEARGKVEALKKRVEESKPQAIE
ncbi:MAG: OmpH family outer membrane protein [Oligosphaeraceae bacterium]|nr:OmpH family outer membrane protein [Oligosphaeraceae bacterium]